MKDEWFVKWLDKTSACGEARRWAIRQPSALEAWYSCEWPDWLLWVVSPLYPVEKSLLCLCDCMELAYAGGRFEGLDAYLAEIRRACGVEGKTKFAHAKGMGELMWERVLLKKVQDNDNSPSFKHHMLSFLGYALDDQVNWASEVVDLLAKDISQTRTMETTAEFRRKCCHIIRDHFQPPTQEQLEESLE